jgi:hypothetical protein
MIKSYGLFFIEHIEIFTRQDVKEKMRDKKGHKMGIIVRQLRLRKTCNICIKDFTAQ